jgi:hypothetical protein
MSDKGRQKTLKQLDDIRTDSAVELRFKDGRQDTVYIQDSMEELNGSMSLFYTHTPPANDSPDFGSKMDPYDFMPRVPFHDIGYLRVKDTGKKISFMPFQKPVEEFLGVYRII